jgi:C-terminal processing protease CtpA/Prc
MSPSPPSARASTPSAALSLKSDVAVAAKRAGIDAERGAFVENVLPASPAAVAGIQPGDVLVAFDGAPIDTMIEWIKTIRSLRPGETVRITIRRGGQELELQPTIVGRVMPPIPRAIQQRPQVVGPGVDVFIRRFPTTAPAPATTAPFKP